MDCLLNRLRPADIHTAGLIHTDDKLSERRYIRAASGTVAHNRGYLWDISGISNINHHLAGGLGHIALLESCAGRIHHGNQRSAHAGCLHGDIGGFQIAGPSQAASHYRKIIPIKISQSSIYLPIAGNDAVCRCIHFIHPQILTLGFGKQILFHKGSLIKQQLNPLTDGQLSFGMHQLLNLGLASAKPILLPADLKFLYFRIVFTVLNFVHTLLLYRLSIAAASFAAMPNMSVNTSCVCSPG